MRRSGGVNRQFAGGSISRGAMARGGFNFGSTSEHPEGLRRDEGGTRGYGAVDEGHIDNRGRGDPKGYGPKDAGHIDASANRSTSYPGGYAKQASRPVQASNARALRGSASETWMQEWYGYPSKRR